MAQRKGLSTLAVPPDQAQLAERLNRELIPFLRQLTPGTVVSGSLSGATVSVLTQLVAVLANAGIITNKTTP